MRLNKSIPILTVLLLCGVAAKKNFNFERLFRDLNFGKFLVSEFNYTSFLRDADFTSLKYVPFQDSSNDTFFRVGLLHKSQLENYTKIKMEEQLGHLKNKPWLPVSTIRDEFANCLNFKYGSFSENEFKYDQGLYGWMNIMKFSCASLNENVVVFAMAFSRTRFRLKQVYLKMQNQMWATSGRSLITRDVQKITEIFAILFSQFVNEKLIEELKKNTDVSVTKLHFDTYNNWKLTNETLEELAVHYGNLRKHTPQKNSRAHTFNTIAIETKTRVMIIHPPKLNMVIEQVSGEIEDAALEVLDSCHRQTCTYDFMSNETHVEKSDTYKYLKENAFIHKVNPKMTFVSFQSAKPYFSFEKTKRKTTAHGLVEIKQNLDVYAKKLWSQLLEQQFTLYMHLHYKPFLVFAKLFKDEKLSDNNAHSDHISLVL